MPGRPRAGFQEPTAPLRLLAGPDRIALGGALGEIRAHRHASSVAIVGLDRPLRVIAERTHVSRAVLIAPGFAHAVDVDGRIAVFILPPHARSRAGMAPAGDLARPGEWVELGQAVARGALASFEPVDRAIARADRGARPISDRLRRALEALHGSLDDNRPIDELAAEVGLSPSRLMALARDELGTSLRSFRRWLRAFSVARDYAAGASLTTAAIDAGFASSAHLSAAARAHFGIRPSQILTPRTRAAIVAC